MDINRSSMLIFHPTSLPEGHGIGDFGKSAYEWLDFLSKSGVRIWQVLPLGPTDTSQFSPYSSTSSTLGNFALIDLVYLETIGLISKDSIQDYPVNKSKVDFLEAYSYKETKLREAHQNLFNLSNEKIRNEVNAFEEQNPEIRNELVFQMATAIYGNLWTKWPKEMIEPSRDTINGFIENNKEEYSYQLFVQYLFSKQWESLKEYASEKNVKVLGDIPIYTNFHSCDVWLNKDLFELDLNNEMSFIAGAAPDIFTAAGQIWGNPLYVWEKHKEQDYRFWKDRLKSCLNKYDLLRIDHFGGLFQFWAIPAKGLGTEGHWRNGPGEEFLQGIREEIDLQKILAEDLFALDLVEMDQAREKFNIPGLKLLNQRIPHKSWNEEPPPSEWEFNFAAYTGTHDTPTVKQWISETTEGQKKHLSEYIENNLNNKQHSEIWDCIAAVWETKCQLAGTMVQDLLELGAEGRFNIPGQQLGNWSWRLDSMDALNDSIKKLYNLNKATKRL